MLELKTLVEDTNRNKASHITAFYQETFDSLKRELSHTQIPISFSIRLGNFMSKRQVEGTPDRLDVFVPPVMLSSSGEKVSHGGV